MFIRFSSGNNRAGKLSELPDEELIAGYKRNRSNDYLAELFERYTHLVFGVCMKYLNDVEESKDATMQVFEELPEKLLEFDIHSFKGWIHTVSRNHCLMKIRKENSVRKNMPEIYREKRQEVMETADPVHLHEGEQDEQKLSLLPLAITRLKEEQRTCIQLVYLEQKSYLEVSEITGYDLKKVKSYVQNGKRNLKIILENYEGQQDYIPPV